MNLSRSGLLACIVSAVVVIVVSGILFRACSDSMYYANQQKLACIKKADSTVDARICSKGAK